MTQGSIVVGVAGGSGSGKTTIAEALANSYSGDQVRVVPLDAYYRNRDDLSFEERTKINYDHPDAFDEELLVQHLAALRGGQAVQQPLYDYTEHLRRSETVEIGPAPVIVLEGILVLALRSVRPLLHLKLFVDTEADVRFLRRLRRDVAERGRTVDSVMEQYLETVRPMHRAFIEPGRRHADLILPGEGKYDRALEVLKAWCASVLGG